MQLNNRPESFGLHTLVILCLLLLSHIPSAATRTALSSRQPQPPAVNLTALTDGTLGNIPAKMLFYQAVLAQMNSNAVDPFSLRAPGDNKTEEEKAEENSAILGGVIGSSLAAGLVNAADPAKALCKALAAGAGNAAGRKTGQLIGDVYPPEEGDKKVGNATSGAGASSTSTTAAKSSQSSKPDPFGAAMVGPLASGFVGSGASGALGKGICDALFGDKCWMKDLADELFPNNPGKNALDTVQKAMSQALANGRCRVLNRVMEHENVPIHQGCSDACRP
jgi:hypothetical protein